MSDVEPGQPAGGEAIPAHVPGGTGELSAREAARSLTDWRNKLRAGASEAAMEQASQPKPEQPVSQPERAPEATAADESADEADAARQDDGPGEDVQKTDPAAQEQPSIEPPERWTQEAKTHWQSIPRETQQYIVQRESERDRLLLQSKNQADEQLKGLSAREQAMEQQTRQLEALTQAQLQEYHRQLQGEFADIKDEHDMQKLAAEDPFRFSRWQAHQSLMAVKTAQVQEAQRRQAEAAQTAFTKFAQEQDKKFVERVPDFADKEKASKLTNAAIKTLTDIGFSQEELTRHWNGQEFISLRDARLQEAFFKAARYDEAQAAAKKAVTNKTLPPVQRPGVAQQGNSHDQEIRALEKRISNTRGNAQLSLISRLNVLRRESGGPR